jgi:hypothetical protein
MYSRQVSLEREGIGLDVERGPTGRAEAKGRSRHGIQVVSITTLFLVCYVMVMVALLRASWTRDGIVSFHSVYLQDKANLRTALKLSSLGLTSVAVGWVCGFGRRMRVRRRHHVRERYKFTLVLTAIGLAIAFNLLATPKHTWLTTQYGDIERVGSGVNILVSAAGVSAVISLCLALQARSKTCAWIAVALCLYSLTVVGILSGNRVEMLGVAVGLAIVYTWYIRPLSPATVVVGGGIVFLTLVQVGHLRTAEKLGISELLEWNGLPPVAGSTEGDVALTLVATASLLDSEELRYGSVEWLRDLGLQVVPSAWWPDRPASFANRIQSITSTGGGSFVVNELLAAGGLGAVVMGMFLVGAVIGRLESIAAIGRFRLAYLIAVIAVPRFVLYGWLSGYKILLTGGLILATVKAVEGTLRTFRGVV